MEDIKETPGESGKKRGGSRTGAGRPKGSGANVDHENLVIRMPLPLKNEAAAKMPNIKAAGLDFTKLIISGFRKQLDKFDYPEGVEPVERYDPVYKKPVVKKGKPGRPAGKKRKGKAAKPAAAEPNEAKPEPFLLKNNFFTKK